MLWLIGLALAGTKADLKAGDAATQRGEHELALVSYHVALLPPDLKVKPRLRAWDGLLNATRSLLFASDATVPDQARELAGIWNSLEPGVGALDSERQAIAADLLTTVLTRLVAANDPADAQRMEGLAKTLGALGQPHMAGVLAGQYFLANGRKAEAVRIWTAALQAPVAAHAPADGAVYLLTEAVAMDQWLGDPQSDTDDDPARALATLETGLERVRAERAETDREGLAEAEQRLALLRVDVLLRMPGDPRARPALEAAIRENPDAPMLKLALATLLERSPDPEQARRAHQLYQDVLKREPDSIPALYGMAAFYVNEAVALRQAANELLDLAEVGRMEAEAEVTHLKAKSYLERIHALDPSDREAIVQLRSIAFLENDVEAADRYGALMAR